MGNNTTYKVNEDGSVTVSEQFSEYERNIIEILRVEKSKGGVFASRRMKKHALKYAETVDLPVFKVEKLMLDSYPVDFANYRQTTWLIIWAGIAASCFIGAIYFAYILYAYSGWDYSGDYFYYCKEEWAILVVCLVLAGISIWQYKRAASTIRNSSKSKPVNNLHNNIS